MRYLVREKFFAIGEDNNITDENGQPVFRVDGKALSLRNLMTVYDMAGNQLAQVHRKLVSMMPQYEADIAGQGTAVIHRRLSNPFKPAWRITLQGQPEMELKGNLFGHNFTIQANGTQVATVSKAWVSLTNTYGVDVAPGQNDLLVLCTVLALEAEQQREQK